MPLCNPSDLPPWLAEEAQRLLVLHSHETLGGGTKRSQRTQGMETSGMLVNRCDCASCSYFEEGFNNMIFVATGSPEV